MTEMLQYGFPLAPVLDTYLRNDPNIGFWLTPTDAPVVLFAALTIFRDVLRGRLLNYLIEPALFELRSKLSPNLI